MSYIKNLLPDDWEITPDPNEEKEWIEAEMTNTTKKYLCIGSGDVEAHWLYRWYKVPYEECVLYHDSNAFRSIIEKDLKNKYAHLLPLTVRPDGDYEQHLKILKTEKLLYGE